MWSLNLFQGNPNDGGAAEDVINGVAGPWSVGSGARTGALVVSGDVVSPEPSYVVPLICIALLLLLRRRTVRLS